jgi:hypothetical protein
VLKSNSNSTWNNHSLAAKPQKGVALFVVLIILTLFFALSIHLNTQATSQSALTASRRVNDMYNNAAEFALNSVRYQLEQDFLVSNDAVSSSADFDKSQVNFSGLLGNLKVDDFEQLYGVDYKTYGSGTPFGLTSLDANRWSVSFNDGRMTIPVRVFVKNNQTDPARSIVGSTLTVAGQEVEIQPFTDMDGLIVVTAIAFGVLEAGGELPNEPMAILTATVSPDPDFGDLTFSRPVGNQGFNNNTGWN